MITRVQARQGKVSARSFSPAPRGGLLQRACACGGAPGLDGECAECRKKRLGLQRRATDSGQLSEIPPIVHKVLRSPGQPLDEATRAFMEPRFGHDFSQVRVHTDAQAVESARLVNALAFTVGHDVVFGTRQYVPRTVAGMQLLAHELTHTVQQSHDGSGVDAERQANAVAARVAEGDAVSPTMLSSAPLSIQMKPDEPVGTTPEPNSLSEELNKFVLNSAALTSKHRGAIDELAAKIAARIGSKAGTQATVTIVGHTDTSGDEKYNHTLGQKRADATKVALERALKKLGAERISIATDSVGEKSLAKDTPDNVREPLNRRVEITLTFGGQAPTVAPPAPPSTSEYDKPEKEKKPVDLNLPPDYKLPEEDWWKRTERELEKIKEYDRKHPRKSRSLTDILVEGAARAVEPIIKKLPEGLRTRAREGIRKGIEAGTERACEAAIDASGVTGAEAEALKAACKAAVKTKSGETK